MGSGSAGYQWGIALVLSLISLTTVWVHFAWARRASGMEAAIIAAGACATWYELVHFAPKALTKVVATHALLPGLFLGMYGDRFQEKSECSWRESFVGSPCHCESTWLRWWNTGGYTHLHQNVPIVLLEQASELEQEPRSFNAVLTRGSLSEPKDGFELAACWNGYCLYRRPGPCAPPQGGNEINYYLRMHGN
jgi:hypothetical protein